MSTANQIRAAFLDYFAKHGHAVIDSSPLVPRNDPTLMFTNAGMVQFKNVFTGAEQRSYNRAATSQKCVRAGGKHNDLENVGYTARHHTFFEMLGNFSFGDYFKDLAIELAWNLVHKEFGLPADRLLATVYGDDDEAFTLWRKISGLPESRIIRIHTSDNFWAMGDTGPCGPCSEIFYDHGEHIPGGPPGSPDEDGDRFVEIWNLVFMQFEQVSKDDRRPLPKPSIDTGMGLERIAAVLQGTHDNYQVDLLRALVEASAHETNTDPDGEHRVSHRVIADHLRASAFLIADGVLPSNEGRGYVLRRIMRRAMRHAQIIGCRDPLMWRLAPVLVRQMGEHFDELPRARQLIEETLKLEEERFKQTLDRGLKLLEEESADLVSGDQFSGEVAFKLYDTYGFPLDLTADALRARGVTVDVAAYEQSMARQKAEARAAWAGSGEAATEEVWFDVRERVGATEFLGYDTERAEGVITALLVDGNPVETVAQDQEVAVLLNQTPFYAESGGQVGDAGTIITTGGGEIAISDVVKRLGDLHVHKGRVVRGPVRVGDEALLQVEHQRRSQIRANHSATHLLHEALRRQLGGHVTQKGSLVAAERLRFDISHPKAVTAEQITEVEGLVNQRIRQNDAVTTRLMTPEQAVAEGAMALFGEKYGDEVRVVTMGNSAGGNSAGGNSAGGDSIGGDDAGAAARDVEAKPFSVELCGGTHVRRTGDISVFKIVTESAVAAGVRRIEALTGEAALRYLADEEKALLDAAALLKVQPAEVPSRIASLLDDRRRLERQLSDARKALATGGGASGGGPEVRQIAGVSVMAAVLPDTPAKDLKGFADELKGRLGSGVVALVAVNDGKASLVVGVSDDLCGRISAVDLVRAGALAVGGKGGGGRPDMAQAGGPDGDQAAQALAAIEAALAG